MAIYGTLAEAPEVASAHAPDTSDLRFGTDVLDPDRLLQASPRLPFRTLQRALTQKAFSPTTWPRTAIARLALVFVFATVCSWTGIVLSRQSEGVATVWFSNGVLFGLLVTQPMERWLAYFAAGLVADTSADMLYGDPFRLAIGVSLANSVEVISSALFLSWWFGSPLDLSRRRSLIGFLLFAVICATAVTSALGASWTLLFVPAGPWPQLFRTWYLGDLLGMAILAPLLAILQRPAFFAILHPHRVFETVSVLALSLLVTVFTFLHSTDPLIFFLSPTLLLVAFRLGFPGTVLNLLITSALVIAFTIHGHGPLMLISGTHMLLHRIVVAQIFVAVTIFTMFPVAALLEEQHALRASLVESERRYRKLAFDDELTGLKNRRAFNLCLEQCWNHALTQKTSLSILLVDADQFKQYNDFHGHLEGDRCLQCLAGVFAEIASHHEGYAARLGGEEFVLLLPDAPVERARTVAEAVRRGVTDKRLAHPLTPTGLQTVSVGVAALVPDRQCSGVDLIELADRALYRAKISGRNQIACA